MDHLYIDTIYIFIYLPNIINNIDAALQFGLCCLVVIFDEKLDYLICDNPFVSIIIVLNNC